VIDKAKALALIEPFEGTVPWMYLDVNGYVTVGIGNLLASPHVATTLVWDRRGGGVEPDEVEVVDEWERVHRAVRGLPAIQYKRLTTMELHPSEIARLFGRRVDEFETSLQHLFPGFAGWPEPAQLATLDMAFNLGAGALPRDWPNLTAALRAQDWRAAAAQSHRPQSRPARNAAVLELFVDAGRAGAVPTSEIT
jgi:GH24 family phage-related lysozyme (muramidase)